MRLCACPRVSRVGSSDPLRCGRCSLWTPSGRPATREKAVRAAEEAISLLTRSQEDYAWLVGSLYGLQRRRGSAGGASGNRLAWSDSTGDLAGSEAHLRARAYASLASRFLLRALLELRRADEAIGEALYALDPGPVPKVDFAVTDVVPSGRPDLAEAHAARARRWARGEGVPG